MTSYERDFLIIIAPLSLRQDAYDNNYWKTQKKEGKRSNWEHNILILSFGSHHNLQLNDSHIYVKECVILSYVALSIL